MQRLASPQQKRVSPNPPRYRRGRLSSSSQRLIYHGSIFNVILKIDFPPQTCFAQNRRVPLESINPPPSIPAPLSASCDGERTGNTERGTDTCGVALPLIERGLRVERTAGTAVLQAAGFVTAQGGNQVNGSCGTEINLTMLKRSSSAHT